VLLMPLVLLWVLLTLVLRVLLPLKGSRSI